MLAMLGDFTSAWGQPMATGGPIPVYRSPAPCLADVGHSVVPRTLLSSLGDQAEEVRLELKPHFCLASSLRSSQILTSHLIWTDAGVLLEAKG